MYFFLKIIDNKPWYKCYVMNREEILEKNKKDNCVFYEMNVYNTRIENENAYLSLKIILIILYITFSVLEKFYTYLNPTKYLISFLLFSGLTVPNAY